VERASRQNKGVVNLWDVDGAATRAFLVKREYCSKLYRWLSCRSRRLLLPGAPARRRACQGVPQIRFILISLVDVLHGGPLAGSPDRLFLSFARHAARLIIRRVARRMARRLARGFTHFIRLLIALLTFRVP